jgi:hypothetical protein
VLAFLAVLPLAAAASDPPVATDAWIPAAPPGAAVHAGYLTLRNPGGRPVVLVAVTSDAHQRAAVHETLAAGTTMTMRQVDEVRIAPGAVRRFAPGGLHLMLFEPTRALAAGDSVMLTLCFGDGTTITVRVPVRDGRSAPVDHEHHHG